MTPCRKCGGPRYWSDSQQRFICSSCRAKGHRDWRTRNPEKATKINRTRAKNWDAKHPGKRMEHVRAWVSKNAARHEETRLDWTMRNKYMITLKERNALEEKQQSLCAICSLLEERKLKTGRVKRLSVDHNHATGKIRELLCDRCNTALGGFRECIPILESAIAYLRKHA